MVSYLARHKEALYSAFPMHKFIIPLFALALLLVSCRFPWQKTPEEPTPLEEAAPPEEEQRPFGYDGQVLTGMHRVILHTSLGDIALELNADSAPMAVTNFMWLARAGYYNALTFHRVVPGFVIQGGDPNDDGTGGTSVFGDTFEDEVNPAAYGHDRTLREVAGDQPVPDELANMTVRQFYESQGYAYRDDLPPTPQLTRGVIAMANSGPNSNSSQFFIIQAERTTWLEGKHTVLGKVVEGMEVVDAIASVERSENDQPLEPVTYDVEVP